MFISVFSSIKNSLRVCRGRDSSANRKVAITTLMVNNGDVGSNALRKLLLLPLPGKKSQLVLFALIEVRKNISNDRADYLYLNSLLSR